MNWIVASNLFLQILEITSKRSIGLGPNFLWIITQFGWWLWFNKIIIHLCHVIWIRFVQWSGGNCNWRIRETWYWTRSADESEACPNPPSNTYTCKCINKVLIFDVFYFRWICLHILQTLDYHFGDGANKNSTNKTVPTLQQ